MNDRLTGSSPRLWGWPDVGPVVLGVQVEFPTPVGMARDAGRGAGNRPRVPHACGDGPAAHRGGPGRIGSSPRLWGWPGGCPNFGRHGREFPTPVGMARSVDRYYIYTGGVPHACGDGPVFTDVGAGQAGSSPRLWGWPDAEGGVVLDDDEFPTPVGMARPARGYPRVARRVPHACGDGPMARMVSACSVQSSPRLWGWPGRRQLHPDLPHEFPTPVGMARRADHAPAIQARVPHACGDGPLSSRFVDQVLESSPRLWGWPDGRHPRGFREGEFPTPVGMARP